MAIMITVMTKKIIANSYVMIKSNDTVNGDKNEIQN